MSWSREASVCIYTPPHLDSSQSYSAFCGLQRMAAVFTPASSHTVGMMNTRRTPLSNNINAANSPIRPPINKRTRSASNGGYENLYEQRPAKRQFLDSFESNVQETLLQRLQKRNELQLAQENRPQGLKGIHVLGSPEKKERLLRERQSARNKTKQERTPEQTAESLKQWKKHYRAQFPNFVFYFETVPEDLRRQSMRSITLLGGVSSLC